MKNTFWVLFETISTVGFQFLSLIILSRILMPFDYGILGMMAIFIALGNMLVDSGLGGALIKKKEVTNLDYSTLFCFNLTISIVFYVLLFLCSDYIASYYEVKELSGCLKIYGIFVIISSLGIVQNTRLVKELRFRELAVISFIANLVAFLFAVYLAFRGWGYWSLIIQHLLYISLRVLGQFIVNKFVPCFRFSRKAFNEQFHFGGSLLLSNLLNTVYNNIISSIIPKIGTIVQNGYYLQASKIQNVPVSILTAVSDKLIFPVLSKQNTEIDALTKARRIMRIALPISYLCIWICILFSKPIVMILLGKEWLPINVYLQILFLSAYGICFIYIQRNIIKSIGETHLILIIESIKSSVGLLLILISSHWGVIGIMWGFVLSSFFICIISILVTQKGTQYSFSLQLNDIWYSLFFPIASFIYVISSICQ